MIPAFLLKPLAGPIAAGVLALLLVALVIVGIGSLEKNGLIRKLENDINNPKTGYVVQLKAARSDLTQCRSNSITLEEAARRQNAAVAAAKASGDRQAAELNRLASDYRHRLEAANAKVQDILSRKPSGDLCSSADKLILESVR